MLINDEILLGNFVMGFVLYLWGMFDYLEFCVLSFVTLFVSECRFCWFTADGMVPLIAVTAGCVR